MDFGIESHWVWDNVEGQGVRAEEFGPIDRFAVDGWKLAARLKHRDKQLHDAYVERMLRFASLSRSPRYTDRFMETLEAGFPDKGSMSPFMRLTMSDWVCDHDMRTLRHSNLRYWIPGGCCHHVAAFSHLLVPRLPVVRLESAKHSLLVTPEGIVDLCFQAARWTPEESIKLLGDEIEHVGYLADD